MRAYAAPALFLVAGAAGTMLFSCDAVIRGLNRQQQAGGIASGQTPAPVAAPTAAPPTPSLEEQSRRMDTLNAIEREQGHLSDLEQQRAAIAEQLRVLPEAQHSERDRLLNQLNQNATAGAAAEIQWETFIADLEARIRDQQALVKNLAREEAELANRGFDSPDLDAARDRLQRAQAQLQALRAQDQNARLQARTQAALQSTRREWEPRKELEDLAAQTAREESRLQEQLAGIDGEKRKSETRIAELNAQLERGPQNPATPAPTP